MHDDTAMVRNLTPGEANARAHQGTVTLVDVRPPQERVIAAVSLPFAALDNGGLEQLLSLPRTTPLAFLCHHGGRSAQAAEYFRAQGFMQVYNVVGGIEAWALMVDDRIPRY